MLLIESLIFVGGQIRYEQFRFGDLPPPHGILIKRETGIAIQCLVSRTLLPLPTQLRDWSRRPLDVSQLHYAARDPYATFLLYEHQVKRGLTGDYLLRSPISDKQNSLPLEAPPLILPSIASPASPKPAAPTLPIREPQSKPNLTEEAIAVLGIITELPTRYSPDGLAASVGTMRVGLAGWIIDRRLGVNAEPDEETVKLAINELCEKELIEITETRRLQATAEGINIWRELKV